MSIRVCAASMEFLGTPQFNGFPKVPWSRRSENAYLLFCTFQGTYIFLIVIIMLNLHLCRYEGQRSVEALAEYVNSEAGRPCLLLRIVLHHVVLFYNYQIGGQ